MSSKFYTLFILFAFFTTNISAQTVVTDSDIVGGQAYTWTSDTEYLLDGYVYVEDGAVLNIEPGTIVRGKTSGSNGDATSALIISRGATLNAIGTENEPIIFTGEYDNMSTTLDFTSLENKQWGGIIILGKAPVGEDGNEDSIEGITSENEPRILYGGNDENDSSGTLKYVSIRHGGNEIAADNEINGLTLGGVGRGTEIDYIEVFANKDDGIEIFGGTVNITHAAISFQGDDALDVDESWDGYVQYIFTLQQDLTPVIGDNAVEYDGSEKVDLGPKTVGRIYNGTFIGSGLNGGNSNGLRLKRDGSAQFWNCVWTDIQGGVFRVEDSAIDRLIGGETVFANNIAYDYGSFEIDPNNAFNITGVENIDPQLASISRMPDHQLDPRPADNNSPLLTNVAIPTEEGVSTPDYRGAFGQNLWLENWSALDTYGYLGDISTSTIDFAENNAGLILSTAIPNPASDDTRFNFSLPTSSPVNIQIVDLNGRLMTTSNLGQLGAGENSFSLNVAEFANGFYIISLQTKEGVVTQKFTVQK